MSNITCRHFSPDLLALIMNTVVAFLVIMVSGVAMRPAVLTKLGSDLDLSLPIVAKPTTTTTTTTTPATTTSTTTTTTTEKPFLVASPAMAGVLHGNLVFGGTMSVLFIVLSVVSLLGMCCMAVVCGCLIQSCCRGPFSHRDVRPIQLPGPPTDVDTWVGMTHSVPPSVAASKTKGTLKRQVSAATKDLGGKVTKVKDADEAIQQYRKEQEGKQEDAESVKTVLEKE